MSWLKAWIAIGLALPLAPGCGGSTHTEAPAEEAAPEPLPEMTLTALDGTTTPVSSVVKGKVAVIDLWATWCTSCRPVSARAASLATVHAKDADFVVVGINIGEDAPTVKAFVEAKKPPHPIYLDPGLKVTDTLGIKELPAIIVVDREGRILKKAHDLDVKVVDLVEAELAKTTGKVSPAGSTPEPHAAPSVSASAAAP